MSSLRTFFFFFEHTVPGCKLLYTAIYTTHAYRNGFVLLVVPCCFTGADTGRDR